MARIASAAPSARAAAVTLVSCALRAAILSLLIAGCVSRRPAAPVPPPVSPTAVASRVLIPTDLDIDSTETVVEATAPDQTPNSLNASVDLGDEQVTFALPDAIAYALANNPRLRSARAAISS